IGDPITTATSEHSRNRYVGFEIGKGRRLAELISSMQMVAEGVATTKSVHELAHSLGVEMPIVDQVYRILYEEVSPQTAIQNLMLRQLKPE
ncbi:MAG TPA: glycerol-3-phosphate dehydrogenase, partial [Candidatus Cloacimonadota bacterium]|nr:glycerol-3-phosphate dehydrogenase [Candidatus Cloacimonadota bacterium]